MLPKRTTYHPTLDRSTLTKPDATECTECRSAKPMALKARGEVIACSECGAIQGVWNRIRKAYDEGFQTKAGFVGGELDNRTPDRPAETLFFKKDMIQYGDINQVNPGPEILNDPIFRQQCENWGYAIYQIGDRLVRIYCKPPDKRVLGDATPGQQPEAYVGIQPGVDPRDEMSTWDNLERDRNKTKAVMRLVMAKSQPLDSDTKKKIEKMVRDAILTLIEEGKRN